MRHFLFLLIGTLATFISANAVDRALLVGIGRYDTLSTGWGVIHGDADVELLKPRLESHGFDDITILTNSNAKKNDIVSALQSLADRSRPGDRVYIHFSGHGQPVKDLNGDEEECKPFDESIIPFDACRDSRKLNGTYNGQNHLIDDELNPLLDAIKKKLGEKGEIFIVVDACYSRGIQKDEYTDLDPDLIKYVRGTDHAFYPKGRIAVPFPKKNFSEGARMYVATACRENERNFEYKAPNGKMYGSLSFFIYILLKSGTDFSVWAEQLSDSRYMLRHIFQPSQHPSVEIIR